MSDLTTLRDHARARVDWQPNSDLRAACRRRTSFGTPKPADHTNCGGGWCGCSCHEPTERERHLWQQIADELDAYLATPDVPSGDHDGLFGPLGSEPTAQPNGDPDQIASEA